MRVHNSTIYNYTAVINGRELLLSFIAIITSAALGLALM